MKRPLAYVLRRGLPRLPDNIGINWREAQELIGDSGLIVDAADPLEVIEQIMRYFYGLGRSWR
jgi:hypothetical protein